MKSLMLLATLATLTLASCASNSTKTDSAEDELLTSVETLQSTSTLDSPSILGEDPITSATAKNDANRSAKSLSAENTTSAKKAKAKK